MTSKQLSIEVIGDISDVLGKLNDLTSALDGIEDRSINVDVNVNDTSLESLNEEANNTADNITSIGDAGEAAGNELDSSMTASSTAIEEAASHANALGTQLDETATSAEDVGDEMAETGDTSVLAMGAATVAAAGLSLGLETVADRINQTQIQIGQLATMTGMAENEMADLLANITNATFPLAEAIAYVKALEQAGVANESLADNATYMDRINDATGVGYNNVIRFSKSLQAMGANLSDIHQYYNAIAYANDNMIGGFETYITWMEKYDSSFKDMGLTVDETAVVIAAATKKFGGGRRAFQGVNNAINESNGDLAVFCQLVGLSADELTNAGTIVGQYEGQLDSLADEEVEHKTITQQLGAIYEDLELRFGNLIGPMASVASITSGTASLFTGAAAATVLYERAVESSTVAENESTAAKSRNLIAATRQKISDISSVVTKKASAVATWLKVTAERAELGNIVRITLANAALIIGMVAHKAATLASTAAQWLLNAAMAANPIGLLVIAIAALVAGLYLLYQNNEQVRESINALWSSIVGLGEYIQEGFYSAVDAIKQPFIDLLEAIEGFGEDMYDAGTDLIYNFIRGIESNIPNLDDVLEEIGKYFPHSPAETGALSEVTPDSMGDYGENLVSGFAGGITTGTNSVEWQQAMDSLSPLRSIAPFGFGLDVMDWYHDEEIKKIQEAQEAQEQANQERIRDAYNTLNELDEATTATYDKIAYSAMSNAEKIDYAFKVATHNAMAYFYQLAEEASGAFSRMTSMLGAMGINLPETTYTAGELLEQRSATNTRLRAKLQELKYDFERSQRGEISSDDSRYLSYYEYTTQKKDIENQIKQLNSYSTTQAIMSAGQNVGSSWGQGVISGITSSTSAINNAAALATQGLYGHSPPETGPLQEIDVWGENVGHAFIEGMETGLSGLDIPLPSSTQLFSSSSSSEVSINFTGDIHVPEGSDPVEVGKGLGQGVNQSLSAKLVGQASNAGVSVVNINR